MSDRLAILADEGGQKSLGFKDAALTAQFHARLRKRKQKMHKRHLSGFERRYSKLFLDNSLVQEKKRIDFVLVHDSKTLDDTDDKQAKAKLKEHVEERARFVALLQKEGFTVQFSTMGKYVYTKLHCPFKRLCREAERVKFEMPLKDCPKLDPVTQTWFTRFLDKYFETDDEEDFISTAFFMNKIEKFEGHENPNTFFRPAVRSVLTHHILINLNIDDLCEKDPEETDEQNKTPQAKKGLRYMLLKKHYIDCFTLHEQSERSSVRGDNYLTSDAPPQRTFDDDPRRDLDDTWTKPLKFQPMWKIRNYFGEKVAFYFAWAGMLISTLWIPSLFGICVFFYGLHESFTNSQPSSNATTLVDSFKDLFGDFKASFDNDVTPFFGLVICVWGTVFLELWKRKKAELAYEWDVDQFESNEPDRPQFMGTRPKKVKNGKRREYIRKDPVTEEMVWYYPFKRQMMKFCFSGSVLIMMIFLVLISVVSIIVYRVVVDIDYCPTMTAAECLVTTTVLSSVLNAISILMLGRVYAWLARKLTKWENHRTQTQFDDALIFKLFAFQFVNSYASCFYIAFFRGRFNIGFLSDKYVDSCEGSCITQLSFQVLVLMVAKPFPKFFKDIILVWIKRFLRRHPNCCSCLRKCSCCPCCRQDSKVGTQDTESGEGGEKKTDNPKHEDHLLFLQHEHTKPQLGDFTLDEYMEKIIQYGFLMLFATSFPLAPLLALVTNMIDIRVDAKRLLWWYRRPIAFVAQDIGMWYQILLFVNFCGVVSNAFIIAFTSSWGAKYSTTGKLVIVIAFEHIVFLLKYVVAYMIPDVPSHVQLSIRREQYQIQKKMESKSEKNVDYTNLFPKDLPNDIQEEDEDGHNGGGDSPSPGAVISSPARRPPRQFNNKSTTQVYQFNNTKQQASDSETGGYVPFQGLETRQSLLNPQGDLWYCGSVNNGSANKAADISAASPRSDEPSRNDMSSLSYDKVSASDVKPLGKHLWSEMDELEPKMSPKTRVHSPHYPNAEAHIRLGGRKSSSDV